MDYTMNVQNLAGNVKSAGWSAMRDAVTRFIHHVMETVLHLEQQEQMGCQRYQRTALRRDYANGSYRRTLSTSYGVVSDVMIPRLRHHPFTSQLLDGYKRRVREVDQMLLAWYLQGESCRDTVRSLGVWASDILSAQSISRIIQLTDQHLLTWRQRPLPHDLVAVWLDGFSVKVRVKHKVRSYTILAALGRHQDGHWEVLSFRLAESESEQRWRELLHQMHTRGMRTQLFIHDGAGGMEQKQKSTKPIIFSVQLLFQKEITPWSLYLILLCIRQD